MHSNLKFALRSLRKTPGFTIAVMLILALGIGANTTIFSLFHQILVRPLPVAEPERLVNLVAPGPKPGAQSGDTAGGAEDVFSYPMFRDLERIPGVFSGIAAHKSFAANLAYGGQVRNGIALLVSGSYFPLLGMRPALGRLLGPADDVKIGGAAVAVLSYDYWQAHFAGRLDVLNTTLRINGQPLTIVGVAPRGFRGTALALEPEVFVPIAMRDIVIVKAFNAIYGFDNRRAYWLNLFARLAPGVSIERARTLLDAPYRAILNDVEAPLQSGLSAEATARFRAKPILLSPGQSGKSRAVDAMGRPMTLLLGITVLVLLIASANIANLLLARGMARRGEIALRLSLGATRRHVIGQLLTESGLLAVGGSLLGLVFAHALLVIAVGFLPQPAAQAFSVTLDGVALSATAAFSLGAGLLFGLLPALQSTKTDLIAAVKGHHQGSSNVRTTWLRNSLVASQAMMAMMLLVSAGLLIRSLSNVGRVDLGFDTRSLVTFRVSPDLNGYTPTRSRELLERLEDDLTQLPGVTAVTASMLPILTNSNWGVGVAIQGFTPSPDADMTVKMNKVGAGYFYTLGIPLLAGREFLRGDSLDSPEVVIVNQQFVRKFNLGADALGKWISTNGDSQPKQQIIGLVQDSKYDSVKGEVPPLVFVPYRQDAALGALNFYIRTVIKPEQALASAAKIVARLDPTLPTEKPRTLAEQVGENIFLDRLVSVLCVSFATLATLLAAIGLYGTLAYTVTQRTREIGVRMALGAQPRAVAWPIVRNALRLAVIGVALGGLVALALARMISSILYGVSPSDVPTWLGAAVLLISVTILAAWVPARRASRIDPVIALRTE